MNEGNLLFISYYFPPIHSVASLRNYYFALHLANHFKSATVLTTSNQKIFPKQEFPTDNLDIIPVPTFDYRTLFHLIYSNKSIHHQEESKRNPFIRFLLKLNDSLPFSIVLGEGGAWYILNAYFKALKTIEKNGVVYCFSSFRVAGNHIISSLLKRRFPNLVWIADFHDLPYDDFRKNAFFPKLQIWFWKKILKNADKVITVSEGLAATLRVWHPNVQVIRDGIVERASLQPVDKDFFIINYTGSVYNNAQNADALWHTLTELIQGKKIDVSTLKIRYAGKDSSLFRSWLKPFQLEQYLEDRGLVSREEAMEMQETASINLLLTWSFGTSKGIVTGKIYEYLSARRPILLLINGEQDVEMENWFDEMQCGEVFYNGESRNDSLKQFLVDLYKYRNLRNDFTSTLKTNTLSWGNQVVQVLKDAY